jgi:hypothetical protein
VNHAVTVRVLESAQHLECYPPSVLQPQLFFAAQAIAEGFPLHVRHGVPHLAGGLAGVEDGQDVGVLEPSGYLDFMEEAIRAKGSRKLRAEQLERDWPLMT